MRRREYLATSSLASVSLLVGCSGGGASEDNTATTEGDSDTAAPDDETTTTGMTATEEPTTASGDADTRTTTTNRDTSTEPQATGTTDEEFTTGAASTPMDADAFVETLEGRLDDKNLMTGYVLDTLADEQVVELTYVASEDNQRKRLEAFAEAFVETVERTGGTGGWSLDMTVQTGAERNVWYTWEVRDEWAVQRLSGELSREEFYAKIEGTTTTPTTS